MEGYQDNAFSTTKENWAAGYQLLMLRHVALGQQR
jgi:hypothetical protein